VEHTIRSGKRSRLGHAHGRVGIAGKGGRVAGGAMLVAVDGPANQLLLSPLPLFALYLSYK